MSRPQRPSADGTRRRIINAACKCFLEKGFHGASMQRIADEAEVNQNLIFHHFQNKRNLWIKVKECIVEKSQLSFKPDVSNLRNFITGVVKARFALYDGSPELVRLIKWQVLEPESAQLSGCSPAAPSTWLDSISYLQRRGEIKPDLEPNNVILLIAGSVFAPFLNGHVEQFSEQQKQAYQQFVIDACVSALVAT